MRGARAGRVLPALAALALAAALAGAARAEDAPADSALHRFLGGLADSTDAYFGMSAQPPDTAGLDSALAYGLQHPGARPRTRLRPEFSPWLGFTRVDGGVFGGGVAIGRLSGLGRVGGRAGWSNGPDVVLGEGTYEKSLRRDDALWAMRLSAGRLTEAMDRDFGDVRLAQVRALLAGRDTKHYLRRDGFSALLTRETPTWRLSARYRDQLESPMATYATWNLLSAEPLVTDNLPATKGHTHELTYSTTFRVGRLPFYGEADYATSSGTIGSDFEYRRTRLATGADLAIGRWLAVVPQGTYGRMTGELVPQAAFYLGGSRTLRGARGSSLGGTGMALARLDLIATPDVLAIVHLPHPDAFPLQAGAFGGIGTVWGRDPYGGPGGVEEAWPEHADWRSEVGLSLLYRPGLPDPNAFMNFSYAWNVGPHSSTGRFILTYTRGLNLLRPLGD
jgi:hypothetical protein